jgi:hypothetical protein
VEGVDRADARFGIFCDRLSSFVVDDANILPVRRILRQLFRHAPGPTLRSLQMAATARARMASLDCQASPSRIHAGVNQVYQYPTAVRGRVSESPEAAQRGFRAVTTTCGSP